MYPFERLLYQLKKDVKNKARVEGSICNAFLVPRNDDGGSEDDDEEKLTIFAHPGRPYGQIKTRRLTEMEFNAAHSYILVNEEKVQPYLKMYEEILKELHPDMNEHDLQAEVDKNFASSFENYFSIWKG
ncbi:hypothetical protein L2E82_30899 [Cichorium intybus]|uniref:Uncharacterized protein n=1 Tax=Cichorium intybus TaxID=13427 RepID=A0ACB9D1W4_CICIN|nr:hypothetical protein L2E82_30899 [Cichorium intybus]